MEWPKGPNPDPKTGSSKTEQSRGNFRKKRPRANMLSSVDSLKERVNPHIPLLKPGNVAELLVFKARVSDHLRESFTLNGHHGIHTPRLEAAKEAITEDGNRFAAATFGFEGSRTVYMAHGGRACHLKDTDILLDTQANVSVFKNKSLLQDVQQVDTEIEISGFVKGQVECTALAGSFLGVDPVYLAPEGAANILSFNQVERGNHDITWVRNSHFDVRFSGTQASVRFRVKANGLYVADGSKLIEEMRQVMVMTAAERERAYPVDQVKRAQEARKLQERLGYPSTDALIRSLNQGALITAPMSLALGKFTDQLKPQCKGQSGETRKEPWVYWSMYLDQSKLK
eukprot:gene11515-8199_t